MENNKIISTKYNKVLWVLFIIIVVANVLLASFAFRSAYFDGSARFLTVLDGISRFDYPFYFDPSCSRQAIVFLNELPTNIAGFVFGIRSKYILCFINTFSQLFLPFLVLLWNYGISKKSGRKDIFAVSLLLYSSFIMLYQIWSIVELSLAVMIFMLLYNYLSCYEKDYSRFDAVAIILLCIASFWSYEVIIFAAPLLYLTAIRTFGKCKSGLGRIVRFIAAIILIFAGIYNLLFIFNVTLRTGSLGAYLFEGRNVCKYFLYTSNMLFSFVGLILLPFCFTKKPFGIIRLIILNIIFIWSLVHLFGRIEEFINPNAENSMRVLLAFAFPLFLFICVMMDFFNKKFSDAFLTNTITVFLTVGILQNIWQINNTYWWNCGVKDLKQKLSSYDKPLYIPEENNYTFSFLDNKTRYISPYSYTPTSIIFADDYNVKTILLQPYDNRVNPGGGMENLYYMKDSDSIRLPGAVISKVNAFWNLTDVQKALIEHNKKYRFISPYEKLK